MKRKDWTTIHVKVTGCSVITVTRNSCVSVENENRWTINSFGDRSQAIKRVANIPPHPAAFPQTIVYSQGGEFLRPLEKGKSYFKKII